jgi:membrane-bound lytic murein transglycosylase D
MKLRAKIILGAVGITAVFSFSLPAMALNRPAAGESDPDDKSSITDILTGLASDPELTEDDAEGALRNVLQHGFAQTRALEHHRWVVPARMPLAQSDRLGWVPQLKHRQTLARLRLDSGGMVSSEEISDYDIPLADHPLVDMYVKHFSGRGRWYFAKWLSRADRYLPIMQPILEAKGVPRDLVYVAMVESGFSARAVSVAAACGYWQFIRSTAKMFGMRMNFWIDERRDFVRATEAAAAYMTQLHKQFGDWHLAWAGYNAGGGRVSRALTRYKTDNFWTLAERTSGFPKETRHYVPKIVAAAIISKNRAKYGFTNIKPLPPLLYDEVEVTDAVDLHVVSRKLGVPVTDLRELNPALLQDVTPPGQRHTLRVPQGQGEATSQWLAALPPSKRLTYRHHSVAKGDTLWKIAARYNSTIAAIRDFNSIRNPKALRVGINLIVPTLRSGAKSKVYSKRPPTTSTRVVAKRTTAKKSSKRHVVAAGETLWSISRRYGISVRDLKARNGLRSNHIVVGDTLRLN